ncbi:2-keto-3-deoxygluconate permease [Pantoea sp. V108_6]|uniref:2-keto-3-deoxygluconate permease n=1 Tax=Pantoea TaxID=53335 RepID=UPI00249DC92E|nr:2-keto-3-deoxygluconate permease [Pantoea sp. V108_6]MDI3363925.1 2-keto-3-deoxygluconate permease [Pantoea sp. V108_6]
MDIKATVEKIPGGMMVVPLVLGAIVNTLAPEALQVGGFTTALFKEGAPALIGAFLFCMGAGIYIKAAPKALLIGGGVTASKFLVAVAVGFAVDTFFGAERLWGLTSVAVISAMSNTNGGLYAALAGEFGQDNEVGATPVISLNDGPVLTMIALGAAGMANIPFMSVVVVIVPMLLGMLLGNLDPKMRDFLSQGGPILIPFFAFALGASIDFAMLLKGGLAGIVLGGLTTLVGGFFNIKVDRLLGGSGIAGAAASSTAGNAVATPVAIAHADPALADVVASATPLVATSVIVTAILTPMLTSWVAKSNQQRSLSSTEKL